MPTEPIAEIDSGKVRGLQLPNGVSVFHAIPYAAPPLGFQRFAAPQPVPPWSGVRDCTERGPSPPQGPSRLDAVMGVAPFAQSEDCLTVTVWTPAADNRRRPVFYWLHGGAYQSGGATQVFYDGANLARAGDMVVVGVNYRLGALGYLLLPEAERANAAPSNRGLLDQMQALRWVAANIASFGGDASNITISGQSAGGGSVLALLANPASRGLVARAIPQSPSTGHLTLERAQTISQRFHAIAGIKQDDMDALRALSVEQIVAAQRAVQMEIAATGDRTIAYQFIAPGPQCPNNPASAVISGAASGIPLLIGTTRDEGHAWLAQDDKLVAETSMDAIAKAAEAGGFAKAAADLPADYKPAGAKPWEVLSAMMTWAVFEKPSRKVADGHVRNGGKAWVYRFDWRPTPDARYGACHCIELPFLFDNLDGWPKAAMMAGHDPASFKRVAVMTQAAWIAFVHNGDPTTPQLPAWPEWNAQSRPCMRLDDTAHVVQEPPIG